MIFHSIWLILSTASTIYMKNVIFVFKLVDKQSEFVRFSNATLLDWKYDI